MDPTRTGTTRTGTTRTGTGARPGVEVSGSDRPRLARHVRLAFSRTRQRQVLLHPETVVVLNGSGADILELCDGRHTVAEIVAELGTRYRTVPDDEVQQFLTRLVARRWVEIPDG
ncbi:pyrroloquinoline quinone biosynthesis peptide chaperone PqqD [Streptomyces hirsutus]|uniref:pyrroloquinoline quinone biosynthesis peptide chaperone PqqD n=1 Tax=Streptomyces hirsutus TaxID=35620 RepID=UPI0036587932